MFKILKHIFGWLLLTICLFLLFGPVAIFLALMTFAIMLLLD